MTNKEEIKEEDKNYDANPIQKEERESLTDADRKWINRMNLLMGQLDNKLNAMEKDKEIGTKRWRILRHLKRCFQRLTYQPNFDFKESMESLSASIEEIVK